MGMKRETGEEERETTAVLAELRMSAGAMHTHASARDAGWGGFGEGSTIEASPFPSLSDPHSTSGDL